jgi:hypothetical protein
MFQSNVRAYESFMLWALREIVLASAFLSLFTTVISFCVGCGAFVSAAPYVTRALFATVAWEVTAIALSSFVLTMFVYLFIRIELNLRMQAEAQAAAPMRTILQTGA